MGLGMMLIAFHVAWACGWVPGLEGFAQSSKLEEVKTQIISLRDENEKTVQSINVTQTAILVRLIRSDIETARAQQCRAIREGNPTAAEGWRYKMQVGLNEYLSSTGQGYALRGCDEY